MGLTVSLVARKGGVGKTSTALNLAGAALDDGAKRVLLVDLDSQASLTRACIGAAAVDALRTNETVQAVATRERCAGDVVRETNTPGILLVPSHPDLRVPHDAALHLAGVDADLVILDTPPDVRDPAVRAALLSSHAVISPVVPEAWGLQSVHSVQQLLMSAGMVSNAALTFAGWLVSMRQRIALHELCENTLRRLHSSTVFDVTIPAAAVFKEASAAGLPVTKHSPRAAGSKAVRALWSELLDRVEAANGRAVA